MYLVAGGEIRFLGNLLRPAVRVTLWVSLQRDPVTKRPQVFGHWRFRRDRYGCRRFRRLWRRGRCRIDIFVRNQFDGDPRRNDDEDQPQDDRTGNRKFTAFRVSGGSLGGDIWLRCSAHHWSSAMADIRNHSSGWGNSDGCTFAGDFNISRQSLSQVRGEDARILGAPLRIERKRVDQQYLRGFRQIVAQ